MMLSRSAQACHGELIGADLEFDAVSINTRTLQQGDLFVALRGDCFDGHDFLDAAKQAGACAALAETETPFESSIKVVDTRKALGLLAGDWCDQFTMERIAVTGNAGKTTVKEMIACMLKQDPAADSVLATEGNFNNEIGVPLTLLRATKLHRYGVFELGASESGEIEWTSSLVKPVVSLITNVTGAHLEGFGSMQGIADAKAEIFSGCVENGVAINNLDDSFSDYFSDKARQQHQRVVTVSTQQKADFQALNIEDKAEGSRFDLLCGECDPMEYSVFVPLPGKHNIANALMAIAAVNAVGVPVDVAIERLKKLLPVPGRVQVCRFAGEGAGQQEKVLIDDTYNANPGSVLAAADLLKHFPSPRLFVLGGLAELGKQQDKILKQLGKDLSGCSVDELVLLPEVALCAEGFSGASCNVNDNEEAAGKVVSVLAKGGSVLVKGSRSAHMERVVEMLKQEFINQNQGGGH